MNVGILRVTNWVFAKQELKHGYKGNFEQALWLKKYSAILNVHIIFQILLSLQAQQSGTCPHSNNREKKW